jgi:hypothetical protein
MLVAALEHTSMLPTLAVQPTAPGLSHIYHICLLLCTPVLADVVRHIR